jgi:hypothetical protein
MKLHRTSSAWARIPAASICLLATACWGAPPPYAAYAIEDDAEAVTQVVVGDATLQDVVRAGRPLVERVGPDQLLRVVVPIRNVDDEEIQVLTQFAFFDNQRRPLPDETNRQVKVIAPGSTSNVEALSRDGRAADFVLRLTWNK